MCMSYVMHPLFHRLRQLAFFLPPLRSFHSATSAGVNVSAFLYATGGYHCGRNHNQ